MYIHTYTAVHVYHYVHVHVHVHSQSQGSSSGSAGTHKRRQFLQHWLKIYPWLTVEGTGHYRVLS